MSGDIPRSLHSCGAEYTTALHRPNPSGTAGPCTQVHPFAGIHTPDTGDGLLLALAATGVYALYLAAERS